MWNRVKRWWRGKAEDQVVASGSGGQVGAVVMVHGKPMVVTKVTEGGGGSGGQGDGVIMVRRCGGNIVLVNHYDEELSNG